MQPKQYPHNHRMKFFDRFKSQAEKKEVPQHKVQWINLTSMDQLETLVAESHRVPVLIYKHSTRCGTSSMVLRQFEKEFDVNSDRVLLYFLDLLANRDISNEVSRRFHVFHESPQLIVLENGKSIHHCSHYQIDAARVMAIL